LLLVACGAAPLSIPIADQSIDFAVVPPTAGKVVYPVARTSFDNKGIILKDLELTGTVQFSGLSSNTTLTLYARNQNPSRACSAVPTLSPQYYVCDASSETAISNALTFTSTQTSQALGLKGDKLVQGINQNALWLGVKVDNTLVNSRLDFKNLLAKAVLF
jgi:hypothetical protein